MICIKNSPLRKCVSMKIREYADKDKKQVISLVESSIERIFKVQAQNLGDIMNIEKGYAHGKFFVAEEDNKVVATVGVDVFRKRGRIRRLFVRESMRKSGIGSKLVAKAIEFCKKRGYDKIQVSTHSKMACLEFYKKAGFVETKREGNRIFLVKTIC